jgi:plasmid stability protein
MNGLVKKSIALPPWMWRQLATFASAHGCTSEADAARRILADRLGPNEMVAAEVPAAARGAGE